MDEAYVLVDPERGWVEQAVSRKIAAIKGVLSAEDLSASRRSAGPSDRPGGKICSSDSPTERVG